MIKVSIHQKGISIILNNKAAKYRKQKLMELKGKIDKFKIIVKDFNTLNNCQNWQAENQHRTEQHHQLYLINIYRTLHQQ